MRVDSTVPRGNASTISAAVRPLVAGIALLATSSGAEAQGGNASRQDPRVGLSAGWLDATGVARGLDLVAQRPRPAGFVNTADLGDFAFANTDMAFQGNRLFMGSYNGFQVWDISNARNPVILKTFVCPGGQGDLSVHGNLLFMSVEDTRSRIDCGTQEVTAASSADRFRGVRIFDISDINAPRQVASVQSCRGSHTHTLVTDPNDRAHVYLYIAGTSPVRPAAELAGCSGRSPDPDPNPSLFQIEVVRVPVAAPQNARIVSTPRIFADSAGRIAGLWRGGSQTAGAQETAETDQCHDITVFPELGLGAGACSGNGLLLDIRDPANPKRIDEVFDANFAYWHSATFNNDGSTVIYTDEWGGGSAPRCQASDRKEWGANAIFSIANRNLTHRGYFKLPAPQTETENCVAHNGSVIPVPGRDIMVQAWYQGGISVFDFTDPANPVEIAYFDRGPLSTSELVLGGHWSAYWYNGLIYGSEIIRGLDVFSLTPTEHLSQNEIDAAKLVRMDHFNPQSQTKLTWPASFTVARAYVDQLVRRSSVPAAATSRISAELTRAEGLQGAERQSALTALATMIDGQSAAGADAARVRALATAVRDLAGTR